MKKIAILSDIHGNNLLLKKVLDCLENDNIEDYVFLGDLVGGFEDNEVLDSIKSKTRNVIAGNGETEASNYDNKSWENLDQWKPRLYVYKNLSKNNLNYISQLPIFKIIEIDGYKICISHGNPYSVNDAIHSNDYKIFDILIKEIPCDIYLFGHTHEPFKEFYKDKLFINPGAICCSSYGKPVSSYGILFLDKERIDYVPKEYYYNFEELKNYYLRSKYHKECIEWSNLFIYSLRDGYGYFQDFIKFATEISDNNKSWNDKFEEFMKSKNLEIFM